MSRVPSLFELLDYALAGEPEVFLFAAEGCGLGAEFDAGLAGGLSGFGLLSLDRLTFPAARHIPIIELLDGRRTWRPVGDEGKASTKSLLSGSW